MINKDLAGLDMQYEELKCHEILQPLQVYVLMVQQHYQINNDNDLLDFDLWMRLCSQIYDSDVEDQGTNNVSSQ